MKKSLWITLGVAGIVALDQLTKWWAVQWLKPRQSIVVIPKCFNFTYVENVGAAWGIFHGQQIFLILFSVLMLVLLAWKSSRWFGTMHGASLIRILLFAGIIGNLIDRIRVQRVIDFIHCYWGAWHFPVFNVADIAICCGGFLLVVLHAWHEYSQRDVSAS